MNKIELIKYLVILVIFLIIDLPMITVINGKMYQEQFLRINKTPLTLNNTKIIFAIISYLALAFAIYKFAVNTNDPFINGCLIGFVIYSIYNGTNKATINEFGTREAIIDTIWGTLLCGIVSLLSVKVIKAYF